MKSFFIRYCYSRESVLRIIIGFMLVSTVFDMGGGLGIKYISYLLGLVSLFFINGFSYNKYHLVGIIGLFVVCPVIFLVKGYVVEMNLGLAFSQVTPFIPAVILFFLLNKDNIDSAFSVYFKSLLILSGIAILFFVVRVEWAYTPLIMNISYFLMDRGMGFFNIGQMGNVVVYGVYFKPTLYLIGALLYFLCYRKPWAVFVVLSAIFIAMSKSSLLVVVVILLIYSLHKIKLMSEYRIIISKFYLRLYFIGMVGFVFLLIYSSEYWQAFGDYCWQTFSGKAETSTIRFGHFHSLIQFWKENPSALFFGQGSGTSFYSSAVGALVNNIELDHFNTIRKFGLLWSGLFYSFILMTFIFLIRNEENIVLGYVLLITFILVGTNPLLINPLFLMFLIMCYKKVIIS